MPVGSVEFVSAYLNKFYPDAKKALELKRADKVIGSSLEADMVIHASGADYDRLCAVKDILPAVFIVSRVEVVNGGEAEFTGETTGLGFDVAKASGEKCERCWIYSDTVGTDDEHPTLCSRCAHTVK